MAKCAECGAKAGFLMSQCDTCNQAAADRQSRAAEPAVAASPPTDRELLERIAALVAQQQADIQTIRWRTGCLFAWLLLTVVLGVFAMLVMRR
jgi:hypothetical protein